MTFTVESDTGTHVDIPTKLQSLLNAASITTLYTAKIVKIGRDFFLCYIVYE